VGKPRSRSGGEAQRLGCVDEMPLRGFPVSLPYCGLKHKVHGRTAPATTCADLGVKTSRDPVTYWCKTRLSTKRSVQVV
jgi:hypothetical protein